MGVSFGCLENPKTMTKAECDAYWFQQEMETQHKINNVSKPYSEIHVAAVQQNNNYISVDGVVEIYDATGLPFTPIVEIDVKNGAGTIEFNKHNYSVFSHTDYYTVFNGKSNYYDMWYVNENLAPLPHHVTTDDTNTVQLLFEDIVKVGYFEPQEHQLINLNNQTSFEFNICVLGAPSGYIKNPVLCFVNDFINPFEGHEFTKYHSFQDRPVTLELVSGAHLTNLPHLDITDIVNDAGWNDGYVPLNDFIKSGNDRWVRAGHCSCYKIDFNVIKYEYLTEKDIMHVYLDDLNGYLNRDIMSYAKADPIHIATIVGG